MSINYSQIAHLLLGKSFKAMSICDKPERYSCTACCCSVCFISLAESSWILLCILIMGCKVTYNQCGLYLRSQLRWRNLTSRQWFLCSYKHIELSLAGPLVVIGQEQSVWCWRSHFLPEGKTLTCHWQCYALAHASHPPSFCLCPKSKSSLAKWQRYRGTLAEIQAWVKWCQSCAVNMSSSGYRVPGITCLNPPYSVTV